MINASIGGTCVEFWRKNNTTLVYLLSNCHVFGSIGNDLLRSDTICSR